MSVQGSFAVSYMGWSALCKSFEVHCVHPSRHRNHTLTESLSVLDLSPTPHGTHLSVKWLGRSIMTPSPRGCVLQGCRNEINAQQNSHTLTVSRFAGCNQTDMTADQLMRQISNPYDQNQRNCTVRANSTLSHNSEIPQSTQVRQRFDEEMVELEKAFVVNQELSMSKVCKQHSQFCYVPCAVDTFPHLGNLGPAGDCVALCRPVNQSPHCLQQHHSTMSLSEHPVPSAGHRTLPQLCCG